MNRIIKELLEIREETDIYLNSLSQSSFINTLKKLEENIEAVGRSSSGSWYGYHAHIYYDNFQPPPAEIYFDAEWGSGNISGWKKYDPKEVKDHILEVVTSSEIEDAKKQSQQGRELFDKNRDNVVSILEIVKAEQESNFINKLLDKTTGIHLFSTDEMIARLAPNQIITRDSLTVTQGLWTPPHIDVLVMVNFLRGAHWGNKNLLKIIDTSIAHIQRSASTQKELSHSGTSVFIGHGRSRIWKDLKDFLKDRLNLEWEEFNRIPIAGITTVDRLKEMLDSASFAFLVMTGEDEQSDGKLHARMNVVHEVGLFQGRLGFKKAIILLEEGCEDFSNVAGLTVIRFEKDKIADKFEEIRRVLEREKII